MKNYVVRVIAEKYGRKVGTYLTSSTGAGDTAPSLQGAYVFNTHMSPPYSYHTFEPDALEQRGLEVVWVELTPPPEALH